MREVGLFLRVENTHAKTQSEIGSKEDLSSLINTDLVKGCDE